MNLRPTAGLMDMSDEARVLVLDHRPARPYLAITSRVMSEAELRRAADQGFPRLFGWLRERAILPAGPPLIRSRAFDPIGRRTAIDVGVPIADAIDGGDSIEIAILPAGEWLTFLHRGPYTNATEPDLAAAHATVRAWVAEHDLPLAKDKSAGDQTALSGCIEQYRIGPVDEPDYARWETEVAYLVDRPREVIPHAQRCPARRTRCAGPWALNTDKRRISEDCRRIEVRR